MKPDKQGSGREQVPAEAVRAAEACIETTGSDVKQLVFRDPEPALDQSPAAFSSYAMDRLETKVLSYRKELTVESLRLSRINRSDSVSANHVEMASMYLALAAKEGLHQYSGTIGGILLGAAISTFLSMTIDGAFTPTATLLSAACAITGTFLVAIDIRKS